MRFVGAVIMTHQKHSFPLPREGERGLPFSGFSNRVEKAVVSNKHIPTRNNKKTHAGTLCMY